MTDVLNVWVTFDLLFANAVDKASILSSCVELRAGFPLRFNPLPDDKILDWSKLNRIADDILKFI